MTKTRNARYEGALRATHCYVARAPCGCIVWAVVDNLGDPAIAAREVAKMIKAGYVPEHLTKKAACAASWGCERCVEIKDPRQPEAQGALS